AHASCDASTCARTAGARPLDAAAEATLTTLLADLPRQYDGDLDWSIYAPDIVFDDPVTLLRGRLSYRGMLLTLRLLAAVATTSADFEVRSADRVAADVLRTMSGVDYFHLDEGGRVARHESQWDEPPAAVWAAVRGKRVE
ncbi:hypothetical protein BU14_0200s0013, partial [Porphyra umbilicalis]